MNATEQRQVVRDLDTIGLAPDGPGYLPSSSLALLARIAACQVEVLQEVDPVRAQGIPVLGVRPGVPEKLVPVCALARLLLLDWHFERISQIEVSQLTRRGVAWTHGERVPAVSPEDLAETKREAEKLWGSP